MRQFDTGKVPSVLRRGLALWAWLATRPRLYQALTRLEMGVLGRLGRRKGRFSRLPFVGAWTDGRDLPAPSGVTFQAAWRRQQREGRT